MTPIVPRVLLTAALAVFIMTATMEAAGTAQVTGHPDRKSLHVGDTLTVTIVGRRLPTDPNFVGATIGIPSHWQRGGQMVASRPAIGDTIVKQWQFQFVPTMAGSTQVTPIVLIGSEVALGAQVDSVLGAAFWIQVSPVVIPPIWPWFLAGAILVIAILASVIRTVQRRREASYERRDEPPLEEALRMLESIRVNRREDRARQYLDDIEHVVHGYISRRLDMPLTGLTPSEIGRHVVSHCPEAETVDALTGLLKRCAESKFGGADVRIDALTGIEGQARTVLERLEANWV